MRHDTNDKAEELARDCAHAPSSQENTFEHPTGTSVTQLSTPRLVAYGGMALPQSLAEVPILLYLPAFYAQEIGLSTALVGAAFLFARCWDGFSDLAVGWLSDKTNLSWGRRKPWVIAFVPCLMLATWVLCNPPRDAGLLYLICAAIFFYSADAAVKIPYHSWGAELATDYAERNRVVGFREAFAMLGSLLFVTAPLVLLPADAPLSQVLLLISITVLIIYPITAIPLIAFVRDAPRSQPTPPPLSALVSLSKDRVLRGFLLWVIIFNVANSIINSLAVFAFGVGLQLEDQLFWIIFLLYVSTLCVAPIAVRLAGRYEKHRALAISTLIVAGTYIAHVFVPPGNFPIVAGLWIFAGLGNAATLILPTSLLADVIDNSEANTGVNQAGIHMAAYNLVKKIGMALGVGVAFGALSLVGFDPSVAHHTTSDAINIRLLAFAVPGLILVVTAIVIWRHPITRDVQTSLRARIETSSRGAASVDQ